MVTIIVHNYYCAIDTLIKKIDICHPHIYTNKTYVKCASILLDLRGLIDIGMFIRYHQSHPSDRCQFDGFLKNKMVIAAYPRLSINNRRQPQPRGATPL